MAGGSSWLTGWNCRKLHEISGSTAGALTNYPIRIKVNFSDGTDSGEEVFVGEECKPDFSDIRFCSADGSTLLDFWMEDKENSDFAIFWVEIPSIPASPDVTTIYVYYGNSSATYAHNNLELDLWQIREYDYSSYTDPDFLFSKPSDSVIRIDSYTNGSSSCGRGYIFIHAKKSYLDGKKIKVYWRAYYSYAEEKKIGTITVVDNPHFRKKTTDEFKDNESVEHPIVDFASIEALIIYSSGSVGWTDWTASTSSILDLSSFSSDYVTILIRGVDAWTGQKTMLDIDYLEILDSSDNVLKTFHFTESVDMEQTGTLRDYGLYRKKADPEPSHSTWGTQECQVPPAKLFILGKGTWKLFKVNPNLWIESASLDLATFDYNLDLTCSSETFHSTLSMQLFYPTISLSKETYHSSIPKEEQNIDISLSKEVYHSSIPKKEQDISISLSKETFSSSNKEEKNLSISLTYETEVT